MTIWIKIKSTADCSVKLLDISILLTSWKSLPLHPDTLTLHNRCECRSLSDKSYGVNGLYPLSELFSSYLSLKKWFIINHHFCVASQNNWTKSDQEGSNWTGF